MLAGTLPRAAGQNSCVSPFIARMYSPGFFASSLCMIGGLNITRGGEQNGWSYSRMPNKATFQLQIKDLSPTMYMYMSGDGADIESLASIMGANSMFNEYMMTLSGIGLVDRFTPLRNMYAKAQVFAHSVWEERLNPFEIGTTLGDRFLPSRVLSLVLPGNLLPG